MTERLTLLEYLKKKIDAFNLKSALFFSFRILIPVLFFAYAFKVIKPEEIWAAFAEADWNWFILGSLCIFLVHYICALRTQALFIDKDLPISTLWGIQAASSLIIGIIPFRAGEFSYVYFLRRYCVIPTTEGFAILVSIRYVEYVIFLCIVFLLSIFGCILNPAYVVWTILAIISLNLAMVVFFGVKRDYFLHLLSRFNKIVIHRVLGNAVGRKLDERLNLFSARFQKAFFQNLSYQILLMTIIIVLLRHLFLVLMIVGMGVSIHLSLLITLFTFTYATSFIQGLGSFGSEEAGIATALIVSGLAKPEALSAAIGTHLLEWVPILLFGSIAYVFLRLLKPK